MKRLIYATFISCLLVMVGCGAAQQRKIEATQTAIAQVNRRVTATITTTPTGTRPPTMTAMPTMMAMPTVTANAFAEATRPRSTEQVIPTPESESGSTENTQVQRRVVLYTANLSIVAFDPDEVIADVIVMVESLGGWVVQSDTRTYRRYDGYDQVSGTIQVRVPADQLNNVVDSIKNRSLLVMNDTIVGNDVTASYVDMANRLENLKQSEEQLRLILDEAEDVEGVLSVFRELTRIRGDIESIEGQLNYYDEASSFSLIRLDVIAPTPTPMPTLTPSPTPTLSPAERWSPSRATSRAVDDVGYMWQGIIDATIHWVIVWGPFYAVGAIVLLIVGRVARRRWMARQTKIDSQKTETVED